MLSPNLPNDPVMLLGTINMKLRDYFSSLDALCDDYGIDKSALCDKLALIDYHYDAVHHQFK